MKIRNVFDRDPVYTCSGRREQEKYIRVDHDGVPVLEQVGVVDFQALIDSCRPISVSDIWNRAQNGDLSLLEERGDGSYADVTGLGDLGNVILQSEINSKKVYESAVRSRKEKIESGKDAVPDRKSKVGDDSEKS